jgi:hypothetical protein
MKKKQFHQFFWIDDLVTSQNIMKLFAKNWKPIVGIPYIQTKQHKSFLVRVEEEIKKDK